MCTRLLQSDSELLLCLCLQEEFNVHAKADCDQLNLAQVDIKNIKKLKQPNASTHLVQYRLKIREGSPEGIRMTMEEMICERVKEISSKSGEKG